MLNYLVEKLKIPIFAARKTSGKVFLLSSVG
jgi:hypothetical protein